MVLQNLRRLAPLRLLQPGHNFLLVESPDVYIAERLFSSSLMVVVSRSTPFRTNIYHFKKGTEICHYSFTSNILAVKFNRQRLVVCLEEALYIHNVKDMNLLKSVLNTPPNPKGLSAISVNHSNSYLAYPGSFTAGEITLYDAMNLSMVTMISAHASHVAAISFSASGTNPANASEKGCLLASVPCYSVPMDSFYVPPVTLRLFISSNWNPAVPEQINIYRFGTTWGKKSPSWSSYMEKMFSAPSTYFPSQVSDMMHQDRAFATVHLSMSGLKNISSMTLLFESDDENQVVSDPEVGSPSYASTVATTSSQDSPSSCSLTGYSEDGGAKKGKLIPEHEFADGPVRQMMKRNFFKLTFKTPEIF